MARAKREKQIEIALEDVELIMGADYRHFDTVVQNVYCSTCPEHMTTIINYKIYLNNLEDLLLQGQCKVCSGPVARYIETGENEDKAAMAKHIREVIGKYSLVNKAMPRIKYAFATSTCGQHFKVVYSSDKEELFEKAKKVMILKNWFDKYLQQAMDSPQGFISIKDPDADVDEYKEILIGESKAVEAYIKAQR